MDVGNIAANVRQRRKLFGWTQTDLARAAGVHRLTIVETEAGRTHPRADVLLRLAQALGMTPNALYET